jgi:hypothetical protein
VPVVNLAFSDDGTRLLTVGRSVSVWDVPTVSKDEAGILAVWAEAVAGMQVVDAVGLRAVADHHAQLEALRKKAQGVTESASPILKMMQWFFKDPAKRTISPLSQVSRADASSR